MVTEVTMPRYGWTMTEGTIVHWLKKEGEEVRQGDPLLVIETEKTQIEVEADASGILRRILVPEGVSVPVAQPIAVISKPDEQLSEPKGSVNPPTKPAHELPTVPTNTESGKYHEKSAQIGVSPRARKLAEQHGVDLRDIRGTGPEGLIVSEDVMSVVHSVKSLQKPSPEELIVLKGRRKAIAEKMAHSTRTAAEITITMEADVSEISQLLKKVKREREVDITYTDFVAVAVAKALREHPLLNSVWQGDRVCLPKEINLGIAVADKSGLVVPVIRNADGKSLEEMAESRRDIVKKVSEGMLSAAEAVGSTFTITNLGMFGVAFFTPIINPPENAILGVGQVARKPAVIEDSVVIRDFMPLSLSFDHRIIDGEPAAIFLRRVKELLEATTLFLDI